MTLLSSTSICFGASRLFWYISVSGMSFPCGGPPLNMAPGRAKGTQKVSRQRLRVTLSEVFSLEPSDLQEIERRDTVLLRTVQSHGENLKM